MKTLILSVVMLFVVGPNSDVKPTDPDTAETFPTEMYGIWQSVENEFLKIQTNPDFETGFVRVKDLIPQASGTLVPADGEILVIRNDIERMYQISYVIQGNTMVVEKPDSNQVWVFNKVGDSY